MKQLTYQKQLQLPRFSETTVNEMRRIFFPHSSAYIYGLLSAFPDSSVDDFRKYALNRAIYGYKGLDALSIYFGSQIENMLGR